MFTDNNCVECPRSVSLADVSFTLWPLLPLSLPLSYHLLPRGSAAAGARSPASDSSLYFSAIRIEVIRLFSLFFFFYRLSVMKGKFYLTHTWPFPMEIL